MAKHINNQNGQAHLPLFLFLLGTLAFSLSTLPSPKDAGRFTVTSLSSEFASDCQNMVNRIDGGANDGSCVISPVTTGTDLAKVNAKVDVRMGKTNHRAADNFNKIVTDDQWETTVEILCNGEECPEGIGRTITVPGHLAKEDYKSIVSKVMVDFNKGASEMAERIKAAKKQAAIDREKKAKRDRCETDSKDRKIEGTARMNCRVARLDHMDEEEAADYYEKYIMPEITNMVGSNDVRKQRAGMALLKQLNGADVGGDFVKESVADLAKFGQFKYQSDQQKLQIMSMNPNDPTRAAAVQQMRMSQMQADMYFRSRGLQVENQDWGIGNQFGFDYGTVMTDNLSNFQNRIDQNYALLLQQQEAYLKTAAATMQPQVVNPNQQPNQPMQVWPQNSNMNGAPPPPANSPAAPATAAPNANVAPPSTQLQSARAAAPITRTVQRR